ncbi:MAG: hypothetical protein Tsb0020_18720 [Haliangiales bacterium]
MKFSGTERFELRGRLGEGGMGVVYEAYDHSRGMRVALKVLRDTNPTRLLRFKREFRALRELSHPNIITLYELVSHGVTWFFTMELVSGKDMVDYIRQRSTARLTRRFGLDHHDNARGGRNRQRGRNPLSPRHDTDLDPAKETSPGTSAHSIDGQDFNSETTLADVSWLPDALLETDETTPLPPTDDPAITFATQTAPGMAAAAPQSASPQPPWTPLIREPKPPLSERVDLERLGDVLAQLAEALNALHTAGLVHRDLKPSNVLVNREGRAVLMDFGIMADTRRPRELTAVGSTQGTPAFMAPEQIRGERGTAATDWYAFGVILYYLLTERLPYEGERARIFTDKQIIDPVVPSHFTAEIPTSLEQLCLALLSREPQRRPTSREVLHALGRAPARERASSDMVEIKRKVFVGRSNERQQLSEIYQDVASGATACVTIAGGSGIGKTCLMERWLSETAAAAAFYRSSLPPSATPKGSPTTGLLVLNGHCHEREDVPYKAFDSVMDQVSQHIASWTPQRRKDDLPADLLLLVRLFPVLRRIPECDIALTRISRQSQDMRPQAVRAVRAVIGALAEHQPTIIWIDDAQWIDADSVDLLLGLLETGSERRPARLLVALCVRQERDAASESPALALLRQSLKRRPSCHHIELGPLSTDEQQALIQAFGARLDQAAIGDAAWQQSSGHPMLLTELARYAASHPGQSTQQRQLDEILWRRVQRLPEVARALFEVVALVGGHAPLRILADAAALPHEDRERALALLEVGQLARITRAGHEPWIDAYHGKLRDAVIAHLDPDHARRLHRALARALDEWPEAPPLARAQHWQAAGEHERAATSLLVAADDATQKLAFQLAKTHYRAALSLLGGTATSADVGSAERLRKRCLALIGLATCAHESAQAESTSALLSHAENIALAHHLWAEMSDIEQLRGTLLCRQGSWRRAQEAHQRALDWAERANAPVGALRALSSLGETHYLRGHMKSAQGHYERCIQLCRAHSPQDIAANLAMQGQTLLYQNQLAAALRAGQEAIALSVKYGDRLTELGALSFCVGAVTSEQGELPRAQSALERAHALARELGVPRYQAVATLFLGRLLIIQRKPAQARVMLEQSLALCQASDLAYIGPIALGALAQVIPDAEPRANALARAENLLRASAAGHSHFYFYRDAMELSFALGDYQGVERYAQALEQFTRDEPVPWCQFFIERARALVERAHRPDDEAALARRAQLRERALAMGFQVASWELDDESATTLLT